MALIPFENRMVFWIGTSPRPWMAKIFRFFLKNECSLFGNISPTLSRPRTMFRCSRTRLDLSRWLWRRPSTYEKFTSFPPKDLTYSITRWNVMGFILKLRASLQIHKFHISCQISFCTCHPCELVFIVTGGGSRICWLLSERPLFLLS